MRNKKARMYASLALAAALLTVVIAGCSNNNGKGASGSPANSSTSQTSGEIGVADSLTITEFNWGWEQPLPELDKVLPEIGKNAGIGDLQVDIVKVGDSNEVTNRLQLWSTTGAADMPHFVLTTPDDRSKLILNTMGESGLLEDLTPWLEKYPAVKAIVQNLLQFTTHPADGKMYFMPQNFSDRKALPIGTAPVWIRKDWLDRVGLPYPRTMDEFYEALKKFRSDIREVNGSPVIPYVMELLTDGGANNIYFPNDKGAASFNQDFFLNQDSGWYTDESGNAHNAAIEHPEYFIELLKFYNKLYHEGLIPQEMFSLKQGQIDEMIDQGRVGAVHGADYNVTAHTDLLAAADANVMYVGIPLYDPRVADKPELMRYKLELYALWAVKGDLPDEEVNAFFKLLDYSVTEEGALLEKFGIEGVHWQRDADGKVEDTPEFFELTQGDWNKRANNGVDFYGFLPNYEALINNQAVTATERRPDMQATWANLGGKFPEQFYEDPQDYIIAGPVEQQKGIGAPDRSRTMQTKAIIGPAENIEAVVMEWVATEKSLGYADIAKERTEAGKLIDMSTLR